MKFHPLEVPNKINEAKRYLNYRINTKDRNGYVYFNVDKINSYYQTALQLKAQLAEDLRELFAEINGKYIDFDPSSRNDMLVILKEYLNIPERELMFNGKVSLKADVIKNLSEKYSSPFIGLYIQYNEQVTFLSSLKTYYENVKPLPGKYNNEGAQLGIYPFHMTYRLHDTYRLNTYEPNIQGLNKEFADIVTAPEGWMVVQVDSSQIEPKIYYSTMVKDPLISWLMSQYDDVYYALADYCLRDSIEFTPDNLFTLTEIDRSHRSTLKTLVNAGNYGSSLDKLRRLSNQMFRSEYFKTSDGKKNQMLIRRIGEFERRLKANHLTDQQRHLIETDLNRANDTVESLKGKGSELAERFYSRLVKHPYRREREKEIDAKIQSGAREIISPFGDKRYVSGGFSHLQNCFINNPIQMAVSRLSAISICEAFEIAEKYPNAVRYAFCKHDEDVYYVRQEIAEELTEKYLQPLRQYEIEGWEPIYAESKIRFSYEKD